jgi:hypothetical protein
MGQPLAPFDTAAGEKPNVVPLLPYEKAPPVVLDLVQPVSAAGRLLHERAELRLKKSRYDFD